MALIIPAIGGKPEAIAIPRLKGRAIKKTIKPEIRSSRQFVFSPAMPVAGRFGKEE